MFVADLLRRADGERSRSGFVLALSVVPVGEAVGPQQELSAGQQSDLLL